MAAWAIMLVLVACFIGSFGPIFLKKGMSAIRLRAPVPQVLFSSITNLNLIAGVVLYVLSQVLFIPALRGGDLSVLYPLAASSYVWVSIWAVLFLKERLSKLQCIGILLVIAVVVVVGFA